MYNSLVSSVFQGFLWFSRAVILRNLIQLNRITENPQGLYIKNSKKKIKSTFSMEFQCKKIRKSRSRIL